MLNLNKFMEEINQADQVIARKWGEEGRDITGDLEEIFQELEMRHLIILELKNLAKQDKEQIERLKIKLNN